jgi:glyoxylase-like metal-dependent hydrolase (beta-lactamase superfamily II)
MDHICAIDEISEIYPVPLAIHPADVRLYSDELNALVYGRTPPIVKRNPDLLLQEGDSISFGTLSLNVLHTPGHTPGSICLVCPSYCVFSGDTLFYRGIGRTDLPGGNYKQIEQSILKKLYPLEDELVVFPGHGQPTTILEEKYENPFVSIEE